MQIDARLRQLQGAAPITPMVTLRVEVAGRPRTLRLKLEGLGASGSIKGRTALALLGSLAEQQALRPGAHLIESTSGNLGIALATYAAELGLRFTAVVDPFTTLESRRLMQVAGAEVVCVEERDETGGYLLSRLRYVREYVAAEGCLWTNQYENAANPLGHYAGTAPEIAKQCGSRQPGMVAVAVSTGGTFAGISRYYREHYPGTRMVAVDVPGSHACLDLEGARAIPGIGASQRSRFFNAGLIDGFSAIDPAAAVAACRWLAALGIDVGGSSGATVAGALMMLHRWPSVSDVVCVCADGGSKYEDTIFEEGWSRAVGFSEALIAALPPVLVDADPFEHSEAV